MLRLLVCLVMLLQTALPARPGEALPARLRSGELLRFHVVAHDDTPAMQRVKLTIRDAVQSVWQTHAPQEGTMLQRTGAILPQLTAAAREAAREAGFTGEVAVHLGAEAFDERSLAGVTIPAGTYPALVIRLGDAQGRNWWGLIDPEAAMLLAAAGEVNREAPLLWDWSWEALLKALFGFVTAEGT